MGKFESALGIWKSSLQGFEFELKPTFKDVRGFRELMMNNSKNKNKLFDDFALYMTKMIVDAYPDEDKSLIIDNVELFINQLFEDAMIQYRWTTKEELEKNKAEANVELKKLIEGV
jgi:hypothetical protein